MRCFKAAPSKSSARRSYVDNQLLLQPLALWRNMMALFLSHYKVPQATRRNTSKNKRSPLYRHWVSVQAVRPIGGVTTALEGGEGSASRPGRFLPPGKEPVPIVQEAGWAPASVWTGAENLAPTGIRSPDRPARSQSLYRLRYPAHEVGPK
jgi:hypothetical protein